LFLRGAFSCIVFSWHRYRTQHWQEKYKGDIWGDIWVSNSTPPEDKPGALPTL